MSYKFSIKEYGKHSCCKSLHYFNVVNVAIKVVWPIAFGTSCQYKNMPNVWGRHSSVDSSVPTILCSRVRIPSKPSMLSFSQILCYSCHGIEKWTKIDKKRPSFAIFLTIYLPQIVLKVHFLYLLIN